MKVENITLGYSPLTGKVYAGVGTKSGMSQKKDVTDNLLKLLSSPEIAITDASGKRYSVTLKEISNG